ncbi:MAG: class I SAM-dependent methyltransferase [Acidobacteria bacterium]|nr:class I SAM-dependent methyltransferase [Acidobacteriota bacterium]
MHSGRPITYNRESLRFGKILLRYVPSGARCFEVGCFPGRYLIFLAKEAQCTVSGIDYSDHFAGLKEFVERNGVTPEALYHEDFLSYRIPERYDFVFSLGFIEHFKNYDEVITRHIELVKSGGILFIACPNFRRAQWALHYLLDRETLNDHHLPSMDLDAWHKILQRAGMRYLEHGYLGTCRFWVGRELQGQHMRWLASRIGRCSRWIERRLNLPNKWTSPYMFSVSMKP